MQRLYQATAALAVLGAVVGPVPGIMPAAGDAEARQERSHARPQQRPRVIIPDRWRYGPPPPPSSDRNYYGPAPGIQPPMQRVPLPAPLADPPINR